MPRPERRGRLLRKANVIAFLLWLILLVLCPPLAILAIVLYAVFWVLLLPTKLIATAIDAVLQT